MTNKTKAATGGAVAAAVLAGTTLFHGHDPTKDVAPGYELVRESNGTYTLYDVHDGKRSRFGENLTVEQADEFTNKKKGIQK